MAEFTKTISVAVNTSKPTESGKQRWSIKDESGEWYSIWEQHVADQLPVGKQALVGIESKTSGGRTFNNIKSVIPPAFAQDVAQQTTPAPAAAPPVGGLFDPAPPKPSALAEIKLTIEERMRAYDVAALLAAHERISPGDLEGAADRALAYYRKSAVPSGQPMAQSNPGSDAMEFVK